MGTRRTVGGQDTMRMAVDGQVLARRTKNNPVLIGDPGVGKTAIIEGIARRIAAREVGKQTPSHSES